MKLPSQEVLVPVSIVLIIIGFAYNLGTRTTVYDSLVTRVSAIEIDRKEKSEQNRLWQRDVLDRLIRIEENLKRIHK